jgi:hypothetical protein
VAHARADQFGAAPAAILEGGVHLHFVTSLRLFDTHYAVEDMRSECASNTTPGAKRTLALWRRAQGVAVVVLQAPAAAFVAALLSGQSLEHALAGRAAAPDDDVMIAAVLAAEVFQAGFVRLTPGDITRASHHRD